MPLTTAQLTPLQRDALREALRSPSHTLVRTAGGYIAQYPRESTSGLKRVRLFTGRLLNMLERDNLVDFDEAPWPNRATLTKQGLALAQQLRAKADAQQAKAAGTRFIHTSGLANPLNLDQQDRRFIVVKVKQG